MHIATSSGLLFLKGVRGSTYPDSGLCEVGPHRDLLSGAHVRIPVPLESGFQLLQLLAGEVSPLPSLFLFLRLIRVSIVTSLLDRSLLFWEDEIWVDIWLQTYLLSSRLKHMQTNRRSLSRFIARVVGVDCAATNATRKCADTFCAEYPNYCFVWKVQAPIKQPQLTAPTSTSDKLK